MKTAVVILNFNRAPETLAAVDAVRTDAPDARIIVVDNASADVEMLREDLPIDVTFLRNAENQGYAGGNNLGLTRALAEGADRILVLNNDVIVTRGCIAALHDAMERHPDWGVVGPLSLLADDPTIVDFISARVDLEHCALNAEFRDGPADEVGFHDRNTDYVTGSAMFFRRAALEKVGPFDERFFLVWEDADICHRIRMAGFACGATPSAVVLHGRGVSFGGDESPLQRYFFVRNSFLIVRKHLPALRRARTQMLISKRYRSWSHGEGLIYEAIRAGLHDGRKGKWGPPPAWLMRANLARET